MSRPYQLLRTDHYTEGVVVDARDTVYFSMTGPGTISRFMPGDAQAETWAHVPAPNGHQIENDGTHIVIASVGAVLALDADGRVSRVVATRVDGRWLTYPNDLSLDHHRGGYFVTDSGYTSTPEQMPSDPQGRVYRVDSSGAVRCVAADLAYANGIALSADGDVLYVGESVSQRIWSYRVDDSGSLSERVPVAQTPQIAGVTCVPDGITVGPDGNLYVAHYGAGEILVYDPAGTLVERLAAGNRTTSHVAFSPDGATLYVSGGIESESGPGAIFAIAR